MWFQRKLLNCSLSISMKHEYRGKPMKKILTTSIFLCFASFIFGQSTYSDNFDAYTSGDYIGVVSPNWTTWSGTVGGAEDAQVVTTQASSGANSIFLTSSSPGGGPQDVVLPFGGEYNTGTFDFQMDMRVESGEGAYFNFQANSTIGQVWAMECRMNQSGNYSIANTNGTYLTGTYPTGAWFEVRFAINLNTNVWEMFIDNVSQGTFSNSVNQVASLNLYPVNQTADGGNNLATFWIDDVSYTHTAYTLPSLNAAVVAVGAVDPATLEPGMVNGLVGQDKVFAATIRNLGVNPITAFDIAYDYNGANPSQTVSGVNIPSLGTEVVVFTAPATLASGSNPLNATVSNVNGMGQDGDANDDVGTRMVDITATAAADKIVVIEEATGTWCQWCPRGAIYMDYMAENYDGNFAGIAVHNNDPMANLNYDTPFGSFISGYPSVVVERGTEVDPLDMEQEFLTKVINAPAAAIVNGATYNTSTRELEVSLSYTFASAANANWKVGCVLVEDSVTGTSGAYAQSNAYGNNAVGPMGGYENFGASVPAASMHYNHVARSISPLFGGHAGFTGPVAIGATEVFNFSFVLDQDWDADNMHIIGILYNDLGTIDNGSITTIDDAIANGYVNGSPVVGVTQPDQPDALVGLYPNPAQDQAWLELNLKAETNIIVRLRDVQGRLLSAHDYGMLNNSHRIPVYTAELAQGMYIVEVQIGDDLQMKRLVVE